MIGIVWYRIRLLVDLFDTVTLPLKPVQYGVADLFSNNEHTAVTSVRSI